jgi:hypothetical protein
VVIVPHLPGATMERMSFSPYVICLGDAELAELESLYPRASAPFRLVLRSRIVLLAAAGTANHLIAERLGICADTVQEQEAILRRQDRRLRAGGREAGDERVD